MYKYCYSNEGAIYAKGLLCRCQSLFLLSACSDYVKLTSELCFNFETKRLN